MAARSRTLTLAFVRIRQHAQSRPTLLHHFTRSAFLQEQTMDAGSVVKEALLPLRDRADGLATARENEVDVVRRKAEREYAGTRRVACTTLGTFINILMVLFRHLHRSC